jgi:hypothetical protein
MSKLEDKGLMERECAREACTSRPCVEVRPPMRQISTRALCYNRWEQPCPSEPAPVVTDAGAASLSF